VVLAFVVVLIAGAAGCSTEVDPCDGKPGVCLGLRVDSEVEPLDELVIRLDGKGERQTPTPPSTLALPVRFAILLSEPSLAIRTYHVEIEGRAGGVARARASADITVDDRGRAAPVSITLRAIELPPDLAMPDLAMADLAMPDLAPPPDLGPTHELRLVFVSINGGSGSVDVSPPGASCGPDCLAFPDGQSIVVSPKPAVGSSLLSFGLPCANQASCALTMDADRGLTVSFASSSNVPNLVFRTQQSFTLAQLGADAANADALCRAAASDAGLPHPNDFIALIARGTTSLSQLLAGSRGWVRVDGLPFADDLAGADTLYPPAVTDEGIIDHNAAWTGYRSDGQVGDTCGGWVDSNGMVDIGSPIGSSQWWLHITTDRYCGLDHPLYCAQRRSDQPLVYRLGASGPSPRAAFVSVGTIASDAGVDAADRVCATEAQQAARSQPFRAFLATDAQSALSRFDTRRGPWQRTSGGVLLSASSATFDPLSLTGMLAPIERTATGQMVDWITIWIGAPGSSCAGWSSRSGTAATAFSTFLERSGAGCGGAAHVLCLED